MSVIKLVLAQKKNSNPGKILINYYHHQEYEIVIAVMILVKMVSDDLLDVAKKFESGENDSGFTFCCPVYDEKNL